MSPSPSAVRQISPSVCAVPAVIVSLGRVQSGAHYPSDVAAGAAIGLASAWLAGRGLHLIARQWLST